MSTFLLVGMAATILAQAPQDPEADANEALCIVQERLSNIKATNSSNPDLATTRCRTRYGWDTRVTNMAEMVASAAIKEARTERYATDAGVDAKLIEEIYQKLAPEEVKWLGIEPGDQVVVFDPSISMRRIGALLAEHRLSEFQRNLITEAIVARAHMHNIVIMFFLTRDRRDTR